MSKHHAIIEFHCVRVSNSMIIKQLKVPKSTVYNTVARFKELGDDKDRSRNGCPPTACTLKIIKVPHERVTPTRWCSFPYLQKNSKHGAEPIFQIFGARKCGSLLHQI